MIKLYMIDGSEEPQSFDLKSDTIYIGRSPDNHVQMKDNTVSRKHLIIVRRRNKYFVKDLKSKNGTFVNGKQISPGIEFELKEGIPIIIGMSLICLGKICLDDVMPFFDPMFDFDGQSEIDGYALPNRPMTYQNNMELIHKVSTLLTKSLSHHEVLKTILHYICDLLKRIDRGVIILIDNKTGKISEVISIIKNDKDDTVTMYSRSIVNRVIIEGKGLIILDTFSEDEANLSESIKLMKIKSVMCVPLIVREDIQGILYLDSLVEPYGFRREDLSLLASLSNPATLAIEKAMLSSRENNGVIH